MMVGGVEVGKGVDVGVRVLVGGGMSEAVNVAWGVRVGPEVLLGSTVMVGV